jgi:hypothetical protein
MLEPNGLSFIYHELPRNAYEFRMSGPEMSATDLDCQVSGRATFLTGPRELVADPLARRAWWSLLGRSAPRSSTKPSIGMVSQLSIDRDLAQELETTSVLDAAA